MTSYGDPRRPRRPWVLRSAKMSPLSWAHGKPSGGTSYWDPRRPRRPWGLRFAKLSPLAWAPGRCDGGTSYGDPRRPRRPWGAAICETVATFVGSWEVQRRDVLRGSEEAAPSLGGCDLRNCRHFRGLLGGLQGWRYTQIRMRPPPPWELRTAKLSPLSWAPGGDMRNGVIRRPE